MALSPGKGEGLFSIAKISLSLAAVFLLLGVGVLAPFSLIFIRIPIIQELKPLDQTAAADSILSPNF